MKNNATSQFEHLIYCLLIEFFNWIWCFNVYLVVVWAVSAACQDRFASQPQVYQLLYLSQMNELQLIFIGNEWKLQINSQYSSNCIHTASLLASNKVKVQEDFVMSLIINHHKKGNIDTSCGLVNQVSNTQNYNIHLNFVRRSCCLETLFFK